MSFPCSFFSPWSMLSCTKRKRETEAGESCVMTPCLEAHYLELRTDTPSSTRQHKTHTAGLKHILVQWGISLPQSMTDTRHQEERQYQPGKRSPNQPITVGAAKSIWFPCRPGINRVSGPFPILTACPLNTHTHTNYDISKRIAQINF